MSSSSSVRAADTVVPAAQQTGGEPHGTAIADDSGLDIEKKELEKIKSLIRSELQNIYKKKRDTRAENLEDEQILDFTNEQQIPEKELLLKKEFSNPALPQCYEEIVRLIDIEKSPIYAKALQEWSRKETLFTNRVERKKKKEANLKNEIYQLIGFFSVFQGVLLTAVSQSNLLHRNNWWSPILLSLIASVVTIAGVIQKLMQIKGYQKTIHSEENSLKEVVKRSNFLRAQGVEEFKFATFRIDKPKEQSKLQFWFYFSLVIGTLIVFAAGFVLSHWRILYDPGPDPNPSSAPSSK